MVYHAHNDGQNCCEKTREFPCAAIIFIRCIASVSEAHHKTFRDQTTPGPFCRAMAPSGPATSAFCSRHSTSATPVCRPYPPCCTRATRANLILVLHFGGGILTSEVARRTAGDGIVPALSCPGPGLSKLPKWNKSETTVDTWRAECGLTVSVQQLSFLYLLLRFRGAG